jgi:hypothetical protein
LLKPKLNRLYKKIFRRPLAIYDYKEAIHFFTAQKQPPFFSYPCVIPNWDNTARSGVNGLVLKNSAPHFFEQHLKQAIRLIKDNEDDKKIIFIKSWNEWAEGNYLEPDAKYGRQYLEVLQKTLSK